MADDTTTPTEDATDIEQAVTEDREHDDTTEEIGSETGTFSAEYVKTLRRENANYRTKAKSAEVLGERLHTELVRSTGKLADPTDLPFDATHLDDADALTAAIDALIEAKPHLAARRITGDVGQGARATDAPFSLGAMLRERAG